MSFCAILPQAWTIDVIGSDVEIVSGMEKVFRPERAGLCSGHERLRDRRSDQFPPELFGPR